MTDNSSLRNEDRIKCPECKQVIVGRYPEGVWLSWECETQTCHFFGMSIYRRLLRPEDCKVT